MPYQSRNVECLGSACLDDCHRSLSQLGWPESPAHSSAWQRIFRLGHIVSLRSCFSWSVKEVHHVSWRKIQCLDASFWRRACGSRCCDSGREDSGSGRSVENCERFDIRRRVDPSVHDINAVSQPEGTGQGRLAQARPSDHLSAHCRNLHALLSSHAAWALGLVAARCGVGIGHRRHAAGIQTGLRSTNRVADYLRGHGLGGSRRQQAHAQAS